MEETEPAEFFLGAFSPLSLPPLPGADRPACSAFSAAAAALSMLAIITMLARRLFAGLAAGAVVPSPPLLTDLSSAPPLLAGLLPAPPPLPWLPGLLVVCWPADCGGVARLLPRLSVLAVPAGDVARGVMIHDRPGGRQSLTDGHDIK